MNEKHRRFADLYIQSLDAIKSYQTVYPKAKHESAKVKSSLLLRNVNIAKYVKEATNRISEVANKKATDSISEEEANRLLNANKKRLILADIANGNFLLEEIYITKRGEEIRTFRKPDIFERLKAVEIDNKMTGDLAPSKVTQTDLEGKSISIQGTQVIFKVELNNSI